MNAERWALMRGNGASEEEGLPLEKYAEVFPESEVRRIEKCVSDHRMGKIDYTNRYKELYPTPRCRFYNDEKCSDLIKKVNRMINNKGFGWHRAMKEAMEICGVGSLVTLGGFKTIQKDSMKEHYHTGLCAVYYWMMEQMQIILPLFPELSDVRNEIQSRYRTTH